MKCLKVFGGSLGYREDLTIPTFRFPAGHKELNSSAACKGEVENPSLLMALSYGSEILSLGPKDRQGRG
jgi:hypothetical protein